MDNRANEATLLERLAEDGVEQLWVVFHDYSGRACAKIVPRNGFPAALKGSVSFAKANLDMDILNHQAPDAGFLADSGDFLVVPDPRSYALLPRHPNVARVHGWLRQEDGSPWDGCPRTRLQEVIDELRREGHSVQAAFEPEFYILTKDEGGDYRPITGSRMYSLQGLEEQPALLASLIGELTGTGVEVDQLFREYGPAQFEVTVRHGDPIRALDDYHSVREAVHAIARDFGYLATFMPKPYADWAGCSLHVHLSLWDAAGERDRTPSLDDEHALSDDGRWFLGGLLAHVDALTALGSPTVNSYKRLQPGSWAPANAYWGVGNRSGVARVPGSGKKRRIEFRSGDNTCQPALFLTGLLAAGLDGIRRRIEPPPPFRGDVGHLTGEEIERHNLRFIPRTLHQALAALEADPVVMAALGPTIGEHFPKVKRSELAQYDAAVHPWERDAYLEVI